MKINTDETFLDADGEIWLTSDQVARRLGVNVRSLVNLQASGQLQAYRLEPINLYKLSQVAGVQPRTDKYVPAGRWSPNPNRGSRSAGTPLEYLEDADGVRWISSSLAAQRIAVNTGNETINHNRVDELRRMGRLQRTSRLGPYHLYDLEEVESFRFGERRSKPRLSDDQVTSGALRKRRFDERRRVRKKEEQERASV